MWRCVKMFFGHFLLFVWSLVILCRSFLQLFLVSVSCFSSALAGCGSHHRAPGHQRQEPAVHRVCDRQQRQDPRQRALRRGGGGLVNTTAGSFTVGQVQGCVYYSLVINQKPNFAKFIFSCLHVIVLMPSGTYHSSDCSILIPGMKQHSYWHQNSII